MATYGIGATPGQVQFTGYTNTLAPSVANNASTAGYVYNNGITQNDDAIAKALRNGGMTIAMKTLLYTLLGAAAGGTATASKKQVQHVTGAPGGLIPIETISLVNRVTTAADLTAFQALVNRTVFPTTYQPDLSGNGGGGHVTY
jgi:hypothetical protein